MHLRLAIVCALAACSSVATASDPAQWVPITSRTGESWEGQAGSGMLETVRGEKGQSVSYLYRYKSGKTIDLRKATARLSECHKGYGTLLINTPEANSKFLARYDYVRGGTTVADHLAEAACLTYETNFDNSGQGVRAPVAWHDLGSNQSGDRFALSKETFKQTTSRSATTLSALVKIKKNEDTSYRVLKLGDRVCKDGRGQAQLFRLSGEKDISIDYIMGGGNMAALTVDFLCSLQAPA